MQFPDLDNLQWMLMAFVLIPLIILLWYYLYFFTAIFKRPKKRSGEEKGVSILICAKNEEENLKKLIPALLNQKYGKLEIVVVNDGSWDGSHQYLQEMAAQNPNFINIYLDPEKKIQSGKKLAITLGIKAAKYEHILFTDADCLPSSDEWVSEMSSQIAEDKVILGYSPYMKKKGFLNWFIRLETQITAFLYLGAGGRRFSYMCVGRNLLYNKASFFKAKGFSAHHHIGAGDDDLQLQEMAKYKIKPQSVIHKNSFVLSVPETTWGNWLNQKRRHNQIGRYYGWKQKLYAGLYGLAHFWFWFALAAFLLLEPQLWTIALSILLFKVLFTWVFHIFLARKLNDISTVWFQPINEFMMMFYWMFMGVYVFFTKKRGW
jgi:glycosyltransferase involved in cell wall biosynthesis